MSKAAVLVALAFTFLGCGSDDRSSMTPGTGKCPELVPGELPRGFAERDRMQVPHGDTTGVTVVYADGPPPDGREVSISAGVPGEFPPTVTDETMRIRGSTAAIYESTSDEILTAAWIESGVPEGCREYAVVTWQLSREEFEMVLRSLR